MTLPAEIKLYDVNSTFVQDSTTMYFGAEGSDDTGHSMAPTNTLNNADGVPGFWVGNRGFGPSNQGAIYGILGDTSMSPYLRNVSAAASVVINGLGPSDAIGNRMLSTRVLGDDSLDDLMFGNSQGGGNNGLVGILQGKSSYPASQTIPFSSGDGVMIYGESGQGLGFHFAAGDVTGDGKSNLVIVASIGSASVDGRLYVTDSAVPLSSAVYTPSNLTLAHEIAGIPGGGLERVALSSNFGGERYIFVSSSFINSFDGALWALKQNVLPSTFSLPNMNTTYGFEVFGQLGLGGALGRNIASGDITGSGQDVFAFDLGNSEKRILALLSPLEPGYNLTTIADGTNAFEVTFNGVSLDSFDFLHYSSDSYKDIFISIGASTNGFTNNDRVCIIPGRATWPARLSVPENCSTIIEGGHDRANLGQQAMVNLGDLRGNGANAIGLSGHGAHAQGLSGNGVAYVIHPDIDATSTSTTTGGPTETDPGSKVQSALFSPGIDELTLLTAGIGLTRTAVDAFVPKQTQQDIRSGSQHGAQQGALRGLSNVMELALMQHNVTGADTAKLLAKALFYMAIFTMNFAQEFSAHGDFLQAFGSSLNTVGMMLATEFLTQHSVRLMDGAADELAQNGWRSSSEAMRKLSHGAARFGVHAHSAVTNGPAFALSSIASAAIVQHTVEKGAEHIGLTQSR